MGRARVSENSRPRIITGFGRSGTTWVLDALAEANSLRPVFEPLHPDHISEAVPYAHRYLHPTDDAPALHKLLNSFFYEEFLSLWVDYRVIKPRLYPHIGKIRSVADLVAPLTYVYRMREDLRKFHAWRRRPDRIVKFIRANMMLAWLKSAFDARIVFIIRHPAAVIASQMSVPGTWNPRARLDRYRSDESLKSALSENVRALLEGELSTVEAYTLSWCIENLIALAQAASSNIPVFYYEHLVAHGVEQWRDITSVLELPAVPDASTIAEPSQQTWGEKANDAALVRRYDSWMERIDKTVAREIQRTLDRAGVTVYEIDNPLPVVPDARMSAER